MYLDIKVLFLCLHVIGNAVKDTFSDYKRGRGMLSIQSVSTESRYPGTQKTYKMYVLKKLMYIITHPIEVIEIVNYKLNTGN